MIFEGPQLLVYAATGWIFRLRDFEKYENIEVQSPKEEAVIFVLPSRREKGQEEKEAEEEKAEEEEEGGGGGGGGGVKKKREKPTPLPPPPQRSSIYQPLKEEVLDESDVMLGTPLIYPSASSDAHHAVNGAHVDATGCPLSPGVVVAGGGGGGGGGVVLGGVAGGGGGGGRPHRRHPGVAGVGGMARIPLLARAAGGGRLQRYQV